MDVEEFKSLTPLGFSKYGLSKDGRVKAFKSGYTSIGSVDKAGYWYFTMSHDEKGRNTKIRVSVALLTIYHGPRPSDKHTADHIDRDPDNNELSNLRWLNSSEQIRNQKKHTKRYGRCVTEIVNGQDFRTWFRVSDAATFHNISERWLREVAANEKEYAGLKWKYALDFIDGEEFRPVDYPSYGQIYVSNKGRVIDSKARISFGSNTSNGYRNTAITIESVCVPLLVHRLVYWAFVDNPAGLFINHKDGNSINNKLENLESATPSENNLHAHATGLAKGQKNGRHSIAVNQYSLDGTFIATYPSQSEAFRQTGVCQGTIGKVCDGKGKTAGGFKWTYVDPNKSEQYSPIKK